ncbi:MAG: DPP IV N-terminal domain-containing protein [Bacteroidota bacterium]
MRKLIIITLFFYQSVFAQTSINLSRLNWLPKSHSFWVQEQGSLNLYDATKLAEKKTFLDAAQIQLAGFQGVVASVVWNNSQDKILIFTNTKKVWRANTKGDYWFFDLSTGKGKQIGKSFPASSLMFAKISPDGKSVAYVSSHNIYLESLATGKVTQLTKDGTNRIINGTFDWVYEEELMCRDGFRWSPDGKSIAFWRVDARKTKNHLMINNTDSLYSFIVPVEYPKAGERPSEVKIGVVNILTKQTVWQKIPGEADNNYLPRIEWNSKNELLVVQMNRYQNELNLYKTEPSTGKANLLFKEKSDTWVDMFDPSAWEYDAFPFKTIENGAAFLWNSDTDGWMHIYKISADGKTKELITTEPFDAYFQAFNEVNNTVYFVASPTDATQRYLYETNLTTKITKRLTPASFEGTNSYKFSTDGSFARHNNSNINRNPNSRLISTQNHEKIFPYSPDVFTKPSRNFTLEKFKVKTVDNIEIDGIMAKPMNFDSTKKYPLFFFAYGEPGGAEANDEPDFHPYIEQLIPRGYIGIKMDNRGSPLLKGREWRKSIYKKIGVINSRDQAMAAKEILKWKYIDPERVAIHGWSGGGAMTLNLMFRYPEIYKTGIAISAVTDQRFYDNIYTERYMGLPQDDPDAFNQASPITFAKNLKGNLLYIHGTGDDNVHYKNAEVLINELIKQNKLFTVMPYPNRTHGINEGQGTSQHLVKTFLKYIEDHCPPGAK